MILAATSHHRSFPSLSSPPSPPYPVSPSFSASTASSHMTEESFSVEQLYTSSPNAPEHDPDRYQTQWSQEDRKSSLPFATQNQRYQQSRFNSTQMHQLTQSHTLSELGRMKALSIYSPPPTSSLHSPSLNYSPTSSHCNSDMSLHIPAEAYLDHNKDWPTVQSPLQPVEQDQRIQSYTQDSAKQHHITMTHSVGESFDQHSMFGIPIPDRLHLVYPNSPTYPSHTYLNSHHARQQRLEHPHQFVLPDELSPSVSASSEYDSFGCDPRFISTHHTTNGLNSWDDIKKEPTVTTLRRVVRPDGSLEIFEHEDADASGEDENFSHCSDIPRQSQFDAEDDDYGPDIDANDDGDGDSDYVYKPNHRRAMSTTSAEGRTLRRRSRSQRFTPYGYMESTDDLVPHQVANRTRRTASHAATSSTSSSVSDSALSMYTLEPYRRRSRAATTQPVPIPVPNLTKKSRGRRVPTATSFSSKGDRDDAAGRKKGNRQYTCKVPGCGKCFARGEHLKRHVRSIHTYEKPHKCPYPGCGKDFSRHDNLGQHMRVHKDFQPPSDKSLDATRS